MGLLFGAFALIKDEEDRFLLVKRRDLDLWNLPGGGAEEKDYQAGKDFDVVCLKREVQEETGLRVDTIQRVGLYLIERLKDGKQSVTESFFCKVTGGKLKLNEEAKAFGWYRKEKLPKNTYKPHRQMIIDFLSQSKTLEKQGVFIGRDLRGLESRSRT